MVRTTGACLALLAFSVAILAGISADNPVTTTLSRALWALAAFYLLGTLLGYVAQRVIDEHALRLHRELFGDAPDPANATTPDAGATEAGPSASPAGAEK